MTLESCFSERIQEIMGELDIPFLSNKRNYWVVRAGAENKCYDDFIIGNYIAVGAKDMSNLDELKSISIEMLKGKLSFLYPNKKSIGHLANVLSNFINGMKIGDIVIVPSDKKISFCEVIGEVYIEEDCNLKNDLDDIEDDYLNKKRQVKWLAHLDKKIIDPKLLLSLRTPNALFKMPQDVEKLVDSHIYKIYKTEDAAFITFDINKESDLDINLIRFQNTLIEILEFYEMVTGENLDLDNSLKIKIRAQSKGRITIKGSIKIVSALSIIGVLISGGSVELHFSNNFSLKTENSGILKYIIEYTKNEAEHIAEMEKIKINYQKEIKNLEITSPEIKIKK